MGAIYQAEDLYVTGRAFAEAARVVALAVERPGNGACRADEAARMAPSSDRDRAPAQGPHSASSVGPSSELNGKAGINHDLQIAFYRAVELGFSASFPVHRSARGEAAPVPS